MWKKLTIFKKNGTSSFNRHQKIYVVLIILVSNVMFYTFALSDNPERKSIILPPHFIKVLIEAKSLVPWQEGQKISLYNSNSEPLIEEAYFMNESNGDVYELAIHEKEISKVVNQAETISILPYQKGKKIERKVNNEKGEHYEIIF
jgi:hypothetical protein